MAAPLVASWFETREDALLTMRVGDLILRSIAKRCVSKDEAIEVEIALGNATRATRLCRRQLQLVGHARQVRQGRCPHLAHYLATMNFYRDFAYAEVGCDLLV